MPIESTIGKVNHLKNLLMKENRIVSRQGKKSQPQKGFGEPPPHR
jgi:hypothetical protein